MHSIRDYDRVMLVANPHSGGGRAARMAESVASALRARGARVEMLRTRRAGDGRETAGQLDGDHCLVLAVGGDGTFNEILNGADRERCTLAVVPAGTGNVLAKELGMSCDAERAVGQLCSGAPARLDAARCNGRLFISVFGAGVDGDIIRRLHAARGDWLTQANYVPYVVDEALQPRRWHIRAEADGRELAADADQVAVGNARSYGGPIEMTPAAVPNDGLLDVMCARLASPVERVSMAACMALRCLHLSPLVTYGRAQRVRVSSGGEQVPYEIDGEAAGYLPAEIEVEPAAVRVLAPATFQPIRREPR
jgi:diacylglycerol kinase (ATP)